MKLPSTSALAAAFARMQWGRGLRGGAVIAVIAVVCTWLRLPLGWACVGGFLSIVVDNGGPYRSRLANIATFLTGGTLACFAGSVAASSLLLSIAVTAVFCFSATFARVLTQPLASSSVAVLVCYFAAFGGGHLPAREVLAHIGLFLSGGLFSASLTLFLWPADPFRPARSAVADCYATLTLLAADLATGPSAEARRHAHDLHSQLRIRMEAAQDALSATPARVPSRTVRARNLAVLLQALDLLFVRILRISELTDGAENPTARQHRNALAAWLSDAIGAIGPALRSRPADGAASFSPEGSHSVDLHRRADSFERSLSPSALGARPPLFAQADAHLAAIERDCLLNLEVAFEAVRAIWSGVESRVTRASALRSSLTGAIVRSPNLVLDALRAHLTLQSAMMRHALRLTAVAVVDVLLMRRIHVTHVYWLSMTSIVVLQPYTGRTLRRVAERVIGTVAGGIVAALLASALPSETALIAVVIVFAVLSAAVYAVDYGWYCFFLTPTFVLLAMPHLRDWHFALVRIGTTGIGVSTAVLAMLVWRERESLQLPRLLARGAAADAAYIRAMLEFWKTCADSSTAVRALAERTVLAPARRACGLAATDAEDSLDRALLEPNLRLRSRHADPGHLNQDALTFTTYLRRLTQSITTLAAICEDSPHHERIVARLAGRLDTIASTLDHPAGSPTIAPAPELASTPALSLASQQIRRMERQVSILERAAADINAGPAPHSLPQP